MQSSGSRCLSFSPLPDGLSNQCELLEGHEGDHSGRGDRWNDPTSFVGKKQQSVVSTERVVRLQVIDDGRFCGLFDGPVLHVRHDDLKVQIELQDDGRTLKVWMGRRSSMTQSVLDAIPECGAAEALYQPEDEPIMVTDQQGQSWMLGYAGGIRYKRKLR